MSEETYSFYDKSLAERLDEYNSILTTVGRIVPASQVRTEWIFDVELVIEPGGWQALWKISPSTCEEYDIRYPTVAKVEVLGMEYSTLNAVVMITWLPDDIVMPKKHEVPLIELYATINQTNNSLDIEGTAHCVDRLRFFYNYLWMPWDEDEDDDIDWAQQHLEPRIRLYYDMNNGSIDKETCDAIRSLISEGKQVRKMISTMESELPDDLHDDDLPEDLAKDACTLMKLHFRLQQMKAEMDLLENPTSRKLLKKNLFYSKKDKIHDDEDKKNMNYFVWLGDSIKKLQELSSKIQTMLPEDAPIKVCECLDETLDIFKKGDTILLSEGHHPIKHSTELGAGGSVIGISKMENTILCSVESDVSSILLDLFGTEILLKNVCIEMKDLQASIIVRKNCTVIVTGCRIRVTDASVSKCKWGAVVMPGGKLVFENTVFQGLGTAVIIYSTGEVVMNECSFEKCHEGIRLNENVNFTATKCSFEGIELPIVMETEKVTSSKSIELGSEFTDVSVEAISLNECKFPNSDKGFIVLRPKDVAGLMESQTDPQIPKKEIREQ